MRRKGPPERPHAPVPSQLEVTGRNLVDRRREMIIKMGVISSGIHLSGRGRILRRSCSVASSLRQKRQRV